MKTKRIFMALLAVIILLTSAGLTFQPAQAATCSSYHTVSKGQTLSWIGRYYGVNWKYLADINNIPYPYKIYPGQTICISGDRINILLSDLLSDEYAVELCRHECGTRCLCHHQNGEYA